MKMFWFKFEKLPRPTIINLGVGVSAYNYDDAIVLLRERMFGPNGPPVIEECLENVKMEDLEKNHVLPNIGNHLIRGVWFPQGYETPLLYERMDKM